MTASFHCSRQSIAPTRSESIHEAAEKIKAWTKQVITKAIRIAKYRGRFFEFSFLEDIDKTWLLDLGRLAHWDRLSSIDGGGRLMEYDDGVFERFDAAVSDSNLNDHDPTLLFIATDGKKIYKAFIAPQSSVGEDSVVLSKGFDEGEFIGIWSQDWMRSLIDDLDKDQDPESSWGNVMERMVLQISDYADSNP